ncbi:hypothetical protein DAMA08_052980 [Martiniozyma asiatica (nom. inval.)]|nr:hypothetical protein DAMA08_052980 [Martiniozyma asiatica]
MTTVKELLSLEGKTCVVTGASAGIGSEIARGFASMGADVILIYNSTPVDALVDDIQNEFKVKAFSYQCDLSDAKALGELMETLQANHDKIDVFVGNAGIGWPHGAITNFDSNEDLVNKYESFMKIELSSMYYCSAYIGKVFEKQGFGNLILTASMSATIANVPQLQAAYNLAKAGVKHLARSLAIEWSGSGGKIRANSVSPGYVDTRLCNAMDELKMKWNDMTPLKRMGKPIEIAGIYAYLASDASTYTTGSDFIVDGGYSSI